MAASVALPPAARICCPAFVASGLALTTIALALSTRTFCDIPVAASGSVALLLDGADKTDEEKTKAKQQLRFINGTKNFMGVPIFSQEGTTITYLSQTDQCQLKIS
jgi:hypothetical protein